MSGLNPIFCTDASPYLMLYGIHMERSILSLMLKQTGTDDANRYTKREPQR
jgi:hypothetical protein